jgi:predicted metal-dependent hydrolase
MLGGKMNEQLLKGVEFFNNARFFEAHEAWEDVWRETTSSEKPWLQGLVQAAVAMHHHSTGNPTGAHSVLRRSINNLSEAPDELHGLNLRELVNALTITETEIARGVIVTPVQIRLQNR